MNSGYYSPNWKRSDSLLFYYDKRFAYSPDVLILQLDDCLLTSKSIAYYNKKQVVNSELINVVPDIYEPQLWTQVRKESLVAKSIVIMCNTHNSSKQLIDNIKFKTEYVIGLLDRPVIALFSLLPNRYMKPHTGMFRFLQMLYKREGHTINSVSVISQDGGLVVKNRLASSDTDRAFAHNINLIMTVQNRTNALVNAQSGLARSDITDTAIRSLASYFTVDEYIGGDRNEFAWDTIVPAPELREAIVAELEKFSRQSSIMGVLEQSRTGKHTTNENAGRYRNVQKAADCWVIAVSGAPRSGRTTFATQLIDQWNKSDLGRHHAVEYFEYSFGRIFWRRIYELLRRGISVIIDGLPPTHMARQPIMQYVQAADGSRSIQLSEISDRAITKTQRFKQDYGPHYNDYKKKPSIYRPKDDVAAIFVEVNCSMSMAQLFNHAAVELAKNETVRIVRQEEYAHYRASYEPINALHPRIYSMVHVPPIIKTPELMSYRY